MSHDVLSLYQIFPEPSEASLTAQELYVQRLYQYMLEEKKLIRQKELLEERKARIQQLKGRYNFKSD
ncbi:hypothetical protein [Cesiribacter sp. SM1]|uniref:hypothetical protein n=1 Tax=Cesiribacter sp. SM1 TaxID=2861196 RepID=UPI001CD270BE|nr:hypothetical protein [Cesiribacter sp. SM1]